ncbi:(2Fe-2S) ferredoxin domain-containing protein [Caulobacter sp. RL271]|jgi:predicted metal-binding protein|uniref:(2Fe-2S) ferredoxin domain-containing protein n=1 Tax=Caulobacter segnis TaxID=88688 RepID=A0ABY4ZXE1_9CAUL|nr:(2Fe-2S) ferredoxin domain-containing protein [Caulobacter segnis]USQ97508.1 (2Fe-2S) ferredoxin domain-containing protein [Caulobacter segnis]
MSDPLESRPIKRVKADWREVVLVCRKCSKKLKGGFGADGDQTLAKALRKALGVKGTGRKTPNRKASAAVIEVDCLDVCPKGAVVVVRASAPGEWVVTPRGTPVAAVLARLELGE